MERFRVSHSLSALFAAVLIFLFIDPYFMWELQKTTPIYLFLSLFLFIIYVSNSDIKTKGRQGLFILFFILLLLSTFYENLNIIGILCAFCVLFVPFASVEFANKTFNYFLTIYSIVILVSSIIWILSILGIIHSIGVINPLNELKGHNYDVYPLLVRANNFALLERFCGPFDEPGVVGTISALILAIKRFDFKDKRVLIVFITGFLSLSKFYIIVVLTYFVIQTFTISKNKILGIAILCIISLLIYFSFDNDLIYSNFWLKFEWNEDTGTIAGDNRITDDAIQLLNKVKGTPAILFGTGKTEMFIKASEGGASLLFSIVQYGLIFVLSYIYFFISYGWRYRKEIIAFFLFVLVFCCSIFQRPFLFQPEFLFLYSLLAMNCGGILESKERT